MMNKSTLNKIEDLTKNKPRDKSGLYFYKFAIVVMLFTTMVNVCETQRQILILNQELNNSSINIKNYVKEQCR